MNTIKFPNMPWFVECEPRGKSRVFAPRKNWRLPDGSVIPRGFKTDGASRPWFVKKWIQKFGRGFSVWANHDYDYYLQDQPRSQADKGMRSNLQDEKWFKLTNREWSELTFLRELRDNGGLVMRSDLDRIMELELKMTPFSRDEAKVVYYALKWFGGRAWRKNAKRPPSYFIATEEELIKVKSA